MTDMTTDSFSDVDPGTYRTDLRAAIMDRGLKRFALFGTSGEGKFNPDGTEETSGFVLNEDGQVWGFWTGWDRREQRLVIDDWWAEPLTPLLTSGRECARARQQLGLN
jgi:hypothetical protein